jgi:GNAT superfamily N-acetyltransferase
MDDRFAVRGVTPDDLAPLSRVAADAFMGDPMMIWFFPDATTRAVAAQRWWPVVIAPFLHAGRGLTTVDGLACLLWQHSDERLPEPPGQPSMRQMLHALVDPVRVPAVEAALAVFPSIRCPGEHVYIDVVASAPEAQGHGRGAALIEALIDAEPSRGLVCLESTNPRNHSFYLRNGFQPGQEATLPGSAIVATAFSRRLG